VAFSRGLFGKPGNPGYIEELLKRLSLWDKRKTIMMHLSGGMKRRVMIAKALSHEPEILFLDEPTAGVDVELRRDMWEMVRKLRADGTTIILTTHYIEEAEEMADRVGVISKGELIAAEDKNALMKKLGRKTLKLTLAEAMTTIPPELGQWNLALEDDGHVLCYAFDANAEKTGVPSLLRQVSDLGIGFKDLATEQSSLEDIFVGLVHEDRTSGGTAGSTVKACSPSTVSKWRVRRGPCGRAWSRRSSPPLCISSSSAPPSAATWPTWTGSVSAASSSPA
jgi:ABC-2 type transport system ATP-binding protein